MLIVRFHILFIVFGSGKSHCGLINRIYLILVFIETNRTTANHKRKLHFISSNRTKLLLKPTDDQVDNVDSKADEVSLIHQLQLLLSVESKFEWNTEYRLISLEYLFICDNKWHWMPIISLVLVIPSSISSQLEIFIVPVHMDMTNIDRHSVK